MKTPFRRSYLPYFFMTLALGGLYAASVYNYNLFLSLACLFSIAITLGIFILVWTSRSYLDNNYLLFIGIAYLFIGSLQMAHTLALEAMYGIGSSTAEHIWVATHYVESLTFLAALLFIGHKLGPRSIFIAYVNALEELDHYSEICIANVDAGDTSDPIENAGNNVSFTVVMTR